MATTNPPRIEQEQEALGIASEQENANGNANDTAEEEEISVFGDDALQPEQGKTQVTPDAELVSVTRENYAVWGVRILVSLVLLGAAVAVCLVVAFREQDNESSDFETAFHELASQFISTFEDHIIQRAGIVQNFARELTSRQNHGNTNMTWPFVTPDDFYIRAESTAELARTTTFVLVPVVEESELEDWIAYSRKNSGWLEDALLYQGLEGEDAKPNPVPPFLYTFANGDLEQVNSTLVEGPYYPIWTQWPVWQTHFTNLDVNHNRRGRNEPGLQYKAVIETNKPAWPDLLFFDDFNKQSLSYRQIISIFPDYQGDALTSVIFPVYNELGKETSENIVAFLVTRLAWNAYFSSIVPEGSPEFDVVIFNQCSQQPTFRINGGKAIQVSKDDVHETKYDYLELTSDVNSLLGVDAETFTPSGGNCGYGIRVYPTSSFEEEYTTNGPLTYALSLAAVFVFTCAVFLLYDWIVERRQKAVMRSALQSGKLVSSLFPKEIREKLYQEQDALIRKEKEQSKKKEWKTQEEVVPESHPSYNIDSSIAKLYPDCTIFFCDVAGFTKWSSTRTPTEVFSLLEAIYGKFDKLAHRYGVFKVETIGDCYVAVTGLPEPQQDHTEIMCKFARACLVQFHLVIAELAQALGEDTTTLEIRVGINSGEVTAGVLRGEKQRFQLFGDSVNVASRMESTGVKGRIQCSQATAKLLQERGKGHWVSPREDMIEAKGKGQMQTYWVDISGKGSSNTGSVVSKTLKNSEGNSSTKGDNDLLEVLEEPNDQLEEGEE